jgi:Tfp pilus assembly protein PilW
VGGALSLLVLLLMLWLFFSVRRRNRAKMGIATNLK